MSFLSRNAYYKKMKEKVNVTYYKRRFVCFSSINDLLQFVKNIEASSILLKYFYFSRLQINVQILHI